MSATLDQARKAKKSFTAQFGTLPELNGVGIANLDGGYGVAVRLKSDPSQQLPTEIDGVPLDIQVIGTISAL